MLLSVAGFSAFSFAAEAKILTNHLGYEPNGPKHAVVLAREGDMVANCALKNYGDDQDVLSVPAKVSGPVQKWRDWFFWTLNFDSFTTEGKYYLECTYGQGNRAVVPVCVQRDLLERNTMSDVIYYFKDERSSARWTRPIAI